MKEQRVGLSYRLPTADESQDTSKRVVANKRLEYIWGVVEEPLGRCHQEQKKRLILFTRVLSGHAVAHKHEIFY